MVAGGGFGRLNSGATAGLAEGRGERRKMKKRNLMIIVLVVLAATAGVAARTVFNQSSRSKRIAYTVVLQATDYNSDGAGTVSYTETRYVASNGNWRAVRQHTDGRSEEIFGEVGRGVFARRGRKLDFLSEYKSQRSASSAERLRASQGYLRTETVLGFSVIVSRAGNATDNSVEFHSAPDLNGDIIKIVARDPESHRLIHVTEPLGITLGEPDAEHLRVAEAATAEVDYTQFEKIHGKRLK